MYRTREAVLGEAIEMEWAGGVYPVVGYKRDRLGALVIKVQCETEAEAARDLEVVGLRLTVNGQYVYRMILEH